VRVIEEATEEERGERRQETAERKEGGREVKGERRRNRREERETSHLFRFSSILTRLKGKAQVRLLRI
jgi:hypothetical protein